ncbi:MAG: GNAT family N-acetyltransferase [Actinomycetota bacterium]
MALIERDASVDTVDVDPLTDPRWAALAATEGASVFTSPPWLRALAATYPNLRLRARLRVGADGAAVAGAAYAVVDDALGARRVALPFSDFADPLGSDAHVTALVDSLVAEGQPVRFRTLHRHDAVGAADVAEGGEAAWHAIGVTEDEDELWSSLRGSARRNIKAARREDLEVEIATGEEGVHRFYDLHTLVRTAKYRLLPQPRDFFAELWREFAPDDAIRVLLARHEGRDIGGILLLDWGDTSFYKFNASLADQLHRRPNDLLLWTAMTEAAARGLRWVDLGVSDLDQEGLVRYKAKFASVDGRVRTYAADAPLAERDELRGLVTDLSRLLSDPDLPPSLAADAGRLLYRYFC